MRSGPLLVIALFLLLFASRLVQDGMPLEGVGYAAVAHNLAHNIGSFWSLKFSDVVYPVYYSHPPLMFGIEALFFKLLGDSNATERIYCAVIMLLTLGLFARVWVTGFRHSMLEKHWPAALGIWMLNPDVWKAYSSNLPDCTMGVFDLFAVWLLLIKWPLSGDQASKQPGWIFTLGAVLATTAAFLTNGFVGLYPLLFFVICRPVHHWSTDFTIKQTAVLVSVLVAILCPLLLFEPSSAAMKGWFEQQSWNPFLQGRFTERIIQAGHLIVTHAHWVVLAVLGWYRLVYSKKQSFDSTVSQSFWLGLSMSIAISVFVVFMPRQSFIPVLPWIALTLSIGLTGFLEMSSFNTSASWLNIVATLMVIAGAGWVMLQNGKIYPENVAERADAREMMRIIPPGVPVACVDPKAEGILRNYLQRYNFSALDPEYKEIKYLIVPKSVTAVDTLPLYFQLLPLPTKKFDLYRRR